MIKIRWPWQNLGCLGFKGKNFYFDIFLKPYFGMYISTQKARYWVNFRERKIRKKPHQLFS